MPQARVRDNVLRIRREQLDAIYTHAREGLPEEVCGILAGRRAEAGTHDVERVYRIKNTHPRPIGQFMLDPQEQLRVTLEVEDELGLEVIGFYHSHPTGPPRLSATDAARASWPGASYFLVYLGAREGHTSARWDAEKGRFEYEDVEVA